MGILSLAAFFSFFRMRYLQMRPESLGLVEELIFGRDFAAKRLQLAGLRMGYVRGSTVITQDTPATCKNSVFGFCSPATLLGIPIPQSLGLRKTAFFSVAPTVVVAADTAFLFSGKLPPVTVLVLAQFLKTAKCEEEAKSWQGQRKMNR